MPTILSYNDLVENLTLSYIRKFFRDCPIESGDSYLVEIPPKHAYVHQALQLPGLIPFPLISKDLRSRHGTDERTVGYVERFHIRVREF